MVGAGADAGKLLANQRCSEFKWPMNDEVGFDQPIATFVLSFDSATSNRIVLV
jgi:hypothetical protein